MLYIFCIEWKCAYFTKYGSNIWKSVHWFVSIWYVSVEKRISKISSRIPVHIFLIIYLYSIENHIEMSRFILIPKCSAYFPLFFLFLYFVIFFNKKFTNKRTQTFQDGIHSLWIRSVFLKHSKWPSHIKSY